MQDLHGDIGSLKEGMSWIKGEISELRKDVKELSQIRWTATGAAAVMGTLSSFIVTIAIKVFFK